MQVVALVRDREARARLHGALRACGLVRFCDEPDDIVPALGGGGVAAVLLELRDAQGSPTAPLVESLRARFPSVPVIAYCDHRHDSSAEILAMARAGVNELVFRGMDDVRLALATVLTSAEYQCAAALVLRELSSLVPPIVRPLVAYCLEHPGDTLAVQRAAAALGVHRKTLVNRMARAGFPSPSALMSWCRLLVAARLLEDPGRPIEQIALGLGFPSGTAYRNMLRRYTGLRPVEVRENGGLRCLLHRFRQALVSRYDAGPAHAARERMPRSA